MKIFAVADLHLSFNENIDKPMNKFGPGWEDHPDRLKDNWEKLVMMVPTPAMVGIIFHSPPAIRKMAQPAMTHTRSVAMRQYLNLPSFHLPESTMATAS